MNVLSLFDGLSGAQLALERAGTQVENYYASEVDKYAIAITMKNYPNTIQLGDVTKLTNEELQKLDVDLLIGGSPCTNLSVAGKQKGLATTCGIDITSLEQYLQLKEEDFEFEGQSYLFWEYIRIKEAIKPKYFLLENVRIPKKWEVQFNEAIHTTPIMINSALLSGQNRVRFYWTNIQNVRQPKDLGILLADVIGNPNDYVDREKAYCIDANYSKGGNLKQYFGKSRRQLVFRPCVEKGFEISALCHHAGTALDVNGHDSLKRVYAPTGKSPALNTMQGGNRHPKLLYKNGEHLEYRKLTVLECERLQTIPDGYTEGVSNSQRYKMIGNGFTINVICHILQGVE